jgi:DNA-binding transcriptional LysR family regulator
MAPDITSLSIFVLAAETRSLTKAADVACLSLAAVSRRIGMLEERFKTQLLTRTPRGVELTDAGVALLAHAKDLLLRANTLDADMSDFAAGKKAALRVRATTSAMTQFLPQDLAGFATQHPQIRLSIGEGWSEEIAKEVLDLKADLGVVVEGGTLRELETRPYRSYRIAAVVPRNHPLARAGGTSFQEVLDHEIVALESGSLMMRSVFEHAVLAQKTFRLRFQVRSFEAVCRLAQAGMGVGLLPMEAAFAFAREMDLAILPLPEVWAERHMVLCFRREAGRGKSLNSLIEHLSASR